jgi:hypothetical protein
MAQPVSSAPSEDETGPQFLLEEMSNPGPHSGPPSLPPHPVPPSRPAHQHRPKPEDLEPLQLAPEPPPLPKKSADRDRGKSAPQRERESTREKPSRKPLMGDEEIDEITGWKGVRGGLRWVQLGLLLAVIPALRCFGELVYSFASYNYEGLPKYDETGRGLLGIGSLDFGHEVAYGLGFGLLILGYFLILIGRLKCTSIPASASPRGLAGWTLFLTFIAFLGAVAFAAAIVGPKVSSDIHLPSYVLPVARTVFITFGLLAELWYVLFLGQAGFAVGNTKILREFGLSALLIAVIISGVIIADQFYPLTYFGYSGSIQHEIATQFGVLNDLAHQRLPAADGDEAFRRLLATSGIPAGIAFLFLFRLIAMSGMLRRSLRRWVDDHAIADR